MIDRIQIDPEIFTRFPSYSASIVYVESVTGGPSDERSRARLRDAEVVAREQVPTGSPVDHPHIAAWREAYSRFGSKPSKYPCSAEALLKRSLSQGLPSINRLVDLYNAVSLENVLPVGGEDFDRLSGTLVLRFARGDEYFEDNGDGSTPVSEGEPVWVDDAGVTCRRWNWRQGRRTALGEGTRNAFFVLDALAPYAERELDAATQSLLRDLSEDFSGCEIRTKRVAA